MAVTCGRGCGSSTPRSRSGCRASGGRLRRHPWGRAGPSGPLSLFVLAPAAFSVPTPSMPSSAGIHAGGRRVGGTSYKHPAPAEARGGGRDDHIAPKRQRGRGAVERCGRSGDCDHSAPKRRLPLPLWSEVVVLATPSPAKLPGRPTPRGRRREAPASVAQANSPRAMRRPAGQEKLSRSAPRPGPPPRTRRRRSGRRSACRTTRT